MTTAPNPSALIASIFNSMSGEIAAATPNTGMGFLGEWPKDGEHDNYLIGLDVSAGKMKFKDGREIDCANIQFKYKLMNDPDHPTPLEWTGSRFQMPQGGSGAVPDEGRKAVVRMETERLLGHLGTILGRKVLDGPDTIAAIGSVQAALQNPSGGLIALQVLCQTRKDKNDPNKTYKSEYIQRRIDRA